MEQLRWTSLSSILIISRWWNDISKEQYARDQIYSVTDSAASGIPTQYRQVKEKSVFTETETI